MAPTEQLPSGLSFIDLGPQSIEAAVDLSSEAGWNQIADDWRMMLGQGAGIGIADSTGSLIASAICLPYGTQFGWISMVLVRKTWRKKGLATQLLRRAIGFFENRGLIPVLDATPAGEIVYKPLGFSPHFGITRWQVAKAPAYVERERTCAVTPEDLPLILALDREVFGGSRETLIKALLVRTPDLCRRMKDGSGYVLARNGRNATQIGPIVARSDRAAVDLLGDVMRRVQGPVFIDGVDDKSVMGDLLSETGFEVQRPFLRMAKGHEDCFGRPDHLYAIAGPELG